MAHHRVKVTTPDGKVGVLKADVVLIATGASPRVLPNAVPDGERILTWRQVYDLAELPEHLIVVGSGVTGAEFCNAYTEMGVKVHPGVQPRPGAAARGRRRRGGARGGVRRTRRARWSRTPAPTRWSATDDGVLVTLADGRDRRRQPRADDASARCPTPPDWAWSGSASSSNPAATSRWTGCRAPRPSGIYAAGDCTGVLLLASVAAMQGRIAMYHALGEGVSPIRLRTVASATFTRPEIAAVGIPQAAIDDGSVPARHADAAAEHQRPGQDDACCGTVSSRSSAGRRRAW